MTGLFIALALLTRTPAVDTENWPDYRGPSANGQSAAVGLPLRFSDTQNVRWKTEIHGRGWSTPVIWGRQIWFTTATPDGEQMYVMCVDKETGKILLDRKLFEYVEPEHVAEINSYASPSAVLEDGRAYVHFGTYGTAAVDTKTLKTLWARRDLKIRHSVGPGSSPVLYRNLLILTMDGCDSQYTIALNKQTGDTLWKTSRTTKWKDVDAQGNRVGAGETRKSFNTPILARQDGRDILVSQGAKAAYAYDAATGKELWTVTHDGYSSSARPLVHGDLAIFNTGYDRSELVAVKLGGEGDVTSSRVAWRYTRNVAFKPSAVLVNGLYYMANDAGILTCVDARTGEEVFKHRLGGHFSASPIVANGLIYWPSEEGLVTVQKPGRTFEALAENQMPEGFMASPAVSGKALYLRTKTHLYRVEGR